MSVAREIIGQSGPVKEMLKMIERVAKAKTNVLIIGESGTGKELVARMIHDLGPLKKEPFVPVNCGAITETLIESELFGHKRGSFTGAVGDKDGLFKAADGGTLFLDEVGELPLAMQVKLLRAIQEKSIRRVGDNETIKVDVRIIAATNRDLEQLAKDGKFRDDLYYRLNVIQIKTPPLRERKSDIPLLIEHFLKRFNEKQGRNIRGLSREASEVMMTYSWPGNIRELENVMQRLVTLETGDEIGAEHFPPGMLGDASKLGPISLEVPDLRKGAIRFQEMIRGFEKQVIAQALQITSGDEQKAAQLLGMKLEVLQAKKQ